MPGLRDIWKFGKRETSIASGRERYIPFVYRKSDSIHHHHPEGVVCRSFCLNSSPVTVSEICFQEVVVYRICLPSVVGICGNSGARPERLILIFQGWSSPGQREALDFLDPGILI